MTKNSYISFVSGTPQPWQTVAVSTEPTYLADAMGRAGQLIGDRDARLDQQPCVLRVRDTSHDGWLIFGWDVEKNG